MAGDIGTGTTIAFSTSSYAANITGVSIDGEEVVVVDASHMGTTGYREKIFGNLKEPPQITCDIIFDPDAQPPVGGASETITITFPIAAGNSAGATLAGTGTIISASVAVPLEDMMTAQYVVQFDGQTDPAWVDGS